MTQINMKYYNVTLTKDEKALWWNTSRDTTGKPDLRYVEISTPVVLPDKIADTAAWAQNLLDMGFTEFDSEDHSEGGFSPAEYSYTAEGKRPLTDAEKELVATILERIG